MAHLPSGFDLLASEGRKRTVSERFEVKEYLPNASVYASRIKTEEWLAHQDVLRQLHEQHVPRAHMLEYLRQRGFHPSLHQLNMKMTEWGFRVHRQHRPRKQVAASASAPAAPAAGEATASGQPEEASPPTAKVPSSKAETNTQQQAEGSAETQHPGDAASTAIIPDMERLSLTESALSFSNPFTIGDDNSSAGSVDELKTDDEWITDILTSIRADPYLNANERVGIYVNLGIFMSATQWYSAAFQLHYAAYTLMRDHNVRIPGGALYTIACLLDTATTNAHRDIVAQEEPKIYEYIHKYWDESQDKKWAFQYIEATMREIRLFPRELNVPCADDAVEFFLHLDEPDRRQYDHLLHLDTLFQDRKMTKTLAATSTALATVDEKETDILPRGQDAAMPGTPDKSIDVKLKDALSMEALSEKTGDLLEHVEPEPTPAPSPAPDQAPVRALRRTRRSTMMTDQVLADGHAKAAGLWSRYHALIYFLLDWCKETIEGAQELEFVGLDPAVYPSTESVPSCISLMTSRLMAVWLCFVAPNSDVPSRLPKTPLANLHCFSCSFCLLKIFRNIANLSLLALAEAKQCSSTTARSVRPESFDSLTLSSLSTGFQALKNMDPVRLQYKFLEADVLMFATGLGFRQEAEREQRIHDFGLLAKGLCHEMMQTVSSSRRTSLALSTDISMTSRTSLSTQNGRPPAEARSIFSISSRNRFGSKTNIPGSIYSNESRDLISLRRLAKRIRTMVRKAPSSASASSSLRRGPAVQQLQMEQQQHQQQSPSGTSVGGTSGGAGGSHRMSWGRTSSHSSWRMNLVSSRDLSLRSSSSLVRAAA